MHRNRGFTPCTGCWQALCMRRRRSSSSSPRLLLASPRLLSLLVRAQGCGCCCHQRELLGHVGLLLAAVLQQLARCKQRKRPAAPGGEIRRAPGRNCDCRSLCCRERGLLGSARRIRGSRRSCIVGRRACCTPVLGFCMIRNHILNSTLCSCDRARSFGHYTAKLSSNVRARRRPQVPPGAQTALSRAQR